MPGIAIARLERQAFVAGLAGVDGTRADFDIANPNDQAVDVTVYVLDSHGDLLPAGENLPVAGRILANERDSTVGAAILARLRRGAGRRIDTLLTAARLE